MSNRFRLKLRWTDAVPDGLPLQTVTDATAGATYQSDPFVIEGISPSATVSISVTGGQISKNGAAFGAGPITAGLGDSFQLSGAASATNGAETLVVASVAGITATLSITTLALVIPTITTPTALSIAENTALDIPLTTLEGDCTWTKTGGADAAQFTDPAGATSTFAAQDYETPIDADANNIYVVQYTATHISGGTATVTISITVENTVPDYTTGAYQFHHQNTASATNVITGPTGVEFTVDQAANRAIVVFSAISLNDTITGVTRAPGDVFTLVNHEYINESGSFLNAEAWLCLNPAVGSTNITVTRSSAVASRWTVAAKPYYDVQQAAPVAVGNFQSTTDGTTFGPGSIVTPDPDCFVVGWASAIIIDPNTAVVTLPAGVAETQPITPTSSPIVGGFFGDNTPAAGSYSYSFDTGGTSRRGSLISIALKGVPHQNQDPIYYFDWDGGANANTGLSTDQAFKSIEAVEARSPLPAGAQVLVKSGQRIRRLSHAGRTTNFLDLFCQGTTAQPVTFGIYGGTDRAGFFGDLVYDDWVAATEAETNADAVALGVEKRATGYTQSDLGRMYFPCWDWERGDPSIWSLSPAAVDNNGWPTCTKAWDDSQDGSDAFYFPDPANVQTSGTTMSGLEVRASQSGTTWTCEWHNPGIAAHYGDRDDVVGSWIVWRQTGNVCTYSRITYYDFASSFIRWEVSGLFPLHPQFYCAVLTCPFDLRQVGQYAFSADDGTMFVAFPAGAVTKSVAEHREGATISGAYVQIADNFVFGRTGGEDGNTTDTAILQLACTNSTIGDLVLLQGQNNQRTGCLTFDGSSNVVIGSLTLEDIQTLGGIRNLGAPESLAINRIYGRNGGRTIVYSTGTATLISYKDIDASGNPSTHGNGASNYGGSNHITIDGGSFLGNVTQISSQTKLANPFPNPKACEYKNLILSGRRPTTTTLGVQIGENTQGFRIDGAEIGSHIDRVWSFHQYHTGLIFGVPIMPKTASDDVDSIEAEWGTLYNNTGTVLERSVIYEMEYVTRTHYVTGVTYTGMQGVTIKDCLFMKNTLADLDEWEAAGATIDKASCVIEDVDGQGALTLKQWEMMSRNDARDGYEGFTLGAPQRGWAIPAYGTTLTLGPLTSDTMEFPVGFQAGRTAGYIYGAMPYDPAVYPNGPITLVAGQGDNDTMFAFDRGMWFFKIPPAAGTYQMVYDEANASATNPTNRSTINITVG